MFIGKQIAIQRGLNNFNRKIPKSKEKAGSRGRAGDYHYGYYTKVLNFKMMSEIYLKRDNSLELHYKLPDHQEVLHLI